MRVSGAMTGRRLHHVDLVVVVVVAEAAQCGVPRLMPTPRYEIWMHVVSTLLGIATEDLMILRKSTVGT